jgi:hypothetical protein
MRRDVLTKKEQNIHDLIVLNNDLQQIADSIGLPEIALAKCVGTILAKGYPLPGKF